MSLAAVEVSTADLLPPIGHNNPPQTLAEILAERYAGFAAEAAKIKDRAASLPKKIDNDIALARFGDVVRDARDLAGRMDVKRQEEVKPHLTAQRETNGFFNAGIETLRDLQRSLEDAATAYNDAKAAEARRLLAEQARKAREEEDRQREIAQAAAEKNRPAAVLKHEDRAEEAAQRATRAEAASQASAADLTRVRSSSGVVATTQTSWDFAIEDVSKIPLEQLRVYIPRGDIEKYVRAFVKINKDSVPLAGVRIFQKSKASFR